MNLVRTIGLPAFTVAMLGLLHCEIGADFGNPPPQPCKPAEDPEAPAKSPGPTGTFDKLNHIVVLYLENHSFDNLYGEFPGAEGLANASTAAPQVDPAGVPYATLPQPVNNDLKPPGPDGRFPNNLPNAPFSIEKSVPTTMNTPDLVHRWYQEQIQIDGGKMDRFANISDAKGLTMGYYHTTALPLAKEAADYTLCDHFFHAAFGGSFLNHQWLIAARSPVFVGAPASVVAQLGPKNKLLVDGFVRPDGCYAVNTAFTVNTPHPSTVSASQLVPQQKHATIGDRLSDANITWAWYSGGWNDAVSGKPGKNFQFHHQPFAYFERYKDGSDGRAQHLKDEADFMSDAKGGTLPSVSFVKPIGELNEHPGYANVADGETHAIEIIDAVRQGPNWKDTAIIITYDENGGFWDHVAPPVVDENGPGTRVPTIVVSAFAKKHFIDATVYDTTSILATIEHRWGLDPLSSRDANAPDLAKAFDFKQTP
jgi:phospholipase C